MKEKLGGTAGKGSFSRLAGLEERHLGRRDSRTFPGPLRDSGGGSAGHYISLPWIGFLVAGFLMLSGCGYRVAAGNRLPSDIRTVAVVPLENHTTTYEVEQVLTRALVHGMVEKGGYRLVGNPARADAVLRGAVIRVSANPVTFGRQTFGSTFLVTVRAAVQFKDRRTNKTLFSNSNFIFREQYQINADQKSFFSEQNPALDRIADDFASSVVTTIMESF